MSKVKAIIPCAGFGTRVGMQLNQSKEMLIWDKEPGQHVIDYSLNLCKECDLEPLVISRAEKTDLNEYLRGKGIEPVIIKLKGEWMDSILLAKKHWENNESNIIILPDTRWDNPIQIIKQIKFQIEDQRMPIALALHEVQDSTKWCVYDNWNLYEKSKSGPGKAFGIMGGYHNGLDFVLTKLSKNKVGPIVTGVQFTLLENFIDITRGEYNLSMGLTNEQNNVLKEEAVAVEKLIQHIQDCGCGGCIRE